MPRITWDRVPGPVRTEIEHRLGARVAAAASQDGGFSPGLASICTLTDGTQRFIKAVSADLNPDSPGMYAEEARIVAAFPATTPVPRLQWSGDIDGWIVLVFDVVHGRQPTLPWTPDELAAFIAAVDAMGDWADPAPAVGAPTLAARLADQFTGWRRFAADGVGQPAESGIEPLDDWAVDAVDALAALEQRWDEGTAGTSLLHADLRADNIIIDPEGRWWFVDWAHAAVGAPWTDLAGLAPWIALSGGPPPSQLWAQSRWATDADPEDVTRFVAGLAGYFSHWSYRPSPRGLPTLRRFQADQAAWARRWLRDRLEA